MFERSEISGQNTFLIWGGGQPDNWWGDENCLEYDPNTKRMNDNNCDNSRMSNTGVSCRFFGNVFNYQISGHETVLLGCQTNVSYKRKGLKM